MENITRESDIDNDFVGYEVLINFMNARRLHELKGDIIEIGAFMGGGTVKLAVFAQLHNKKVYAIDIFDPGYDETRDSGGVRMCDIYEEFLQGRSQWDVYRETTRGFDSIITIDKDSRAVNFPQEQQFIFGFIDGNHQPEYVINDFYLIWHNLVPGGSIGFHDYNYDLPEVTAAIDRLIDEHKEELYEVHEIGEKHIVLLTKKKC